MEKIYSIYLEELKNLQEQIDYFHKCFCSKTNKRMKHKNTHLLKSIHKEIAKYEKTSNERNINKN